MKKMCRMIITLAALSIGLSPFVPVSYSFKLKLPGKDSGEQSFNLEELKKEDKLIRSLVAKASEVFLVGTSKIFKAHGQKEQAKKFQASADDISKDPEDPQKIKDAFKVVEEGNRLLAQIEANKFQLSKAGRKEFGQGVVWVGAGGILDTVGGKRTSAYVDKLKDAIEVVKDDPLKYSAGTTNYLKDNLSLMKFLATNLPKHGAAIGDTFAGLIKYASVNGITITKSDAQKFADTIEKG